MQPLWRIVWRFLKKLKIELPYDSAILLLDKSGEKHGPKGYLHPNTHRSPIYNTQSWKQLKCPSTDEWIKKMCYISTMEYYTAIKKNGIMPFAAAWMDPEIVILSKVSQTAKEKYHNILLICRILKKMTQMNLFTKQNQTHRLRERT